MAQGDDEQFQRKLRGWKFADQAKKEAARGTIGPYDEEDRPGREVIAPLTRDTADRMRAQGEAATRKARPYKGRPMSDTRTLHRRNGRR